MRHSIRHVCFALILLLHVAASDWSELQQLKYLAKKRAKIRTVLLENLQKCQRSLKTFLGPVDMVAGTYGGSYGTHQFSRRKLLTCDGVSCDRNLQLAIATYITNIV